MTSRSASAARPACCRCHSRRAAGRSRNCAPFLNLPDRDDFVLVVAWLLGALRAGGPFPLLAISGEQGSAKTVLSKMLRALIDPSVAPVRALPREDRELFIAANNGHVLAFDNLTSLSPWLSDTLCRLTSGGAFAVRQLYTDQDEVLFAAARPVILNGIEDVITRPDLADRAIMLTLGPITRSAAAPGERAVAGVRASRDRTFWARCSMRQRTACKHCPGFGSNACRAWPTLRSGPRPARPPAGRPARSKTRIGTTAAPRSKTSSTPTRWPPGCATSWRSGRPGRALRPICCRRALRPSGNAIAGKTSVPVRWPRNPRALAGRLRRAQTFLRTLGIEIDFGREGRVGTRIIRMSAARKIRPAISSAPSAATALDGQDVHRQSRAAYTGDGVAVGAKTTECGTGGRTRRTTSTGRCGPSTLQFCCSPGPEADAGEPPAVGTRLQATFSGQMGQDARTPNATPARRYAAGLIAIRPAGARRFFALTMPTQSNKILN